MGKCHKVAVQIQNLHLQLNCIVSLLKEVGMVLGVNWLASLGTYSTNLQKQYMEFKCNGSKYLLYGLRSLYPKHEESWHKKDSDSHQDREINLDRISQIKHKHKSRTKDDVSKFSFEEKDSLKGKAMLRK